MLRIFLVTCVLLPIVATSARTGAGGRDNSIPKDLLAMLETAEQFELSSLSPEAEKSKNAFHGWKVLGKTVVKDKATQKKLVAAFKKGVAENKGGPAFCFTPRHGIRVVNNGKTADFVICFECFQVQAYDGEKLKANLGVTRSPQALFNDVLIQAKVPMPKKQKN